MRKDWVLTLLEKGKYKKQETREGCCCETETLSLWLLLGSFARVILDHHRSHGQGNATQPPASLHISIPKTVSRHSLTLSSSSTRPRLKPLA